MFFIQWNYWNFVKMIVSQGITSFQKVLQTPLLLRKNTLSNAHLFSFECSWTCDILFNYDLIFFLFIFQHEWNYMIHLQHIIHMISPEVKNNYL